LQPHFGVNRVATWSPSVSTTVTTDGMPRTAVGTVATPTLATTGLAASIRRWRVTSATTANAAAEERSAGWVCWRGNAEGLGGWNYVNRLSLTTLQATGMGFFGLYGSTAALATTLTLATVINCIGIGFQRGTHANWQLVHNDGAGAPTLIDLGASFPVASLTNVLTLYIAATPNGSDIGVRVVEEVSGAAVEFTITTDMPAATQLLSPRNYMNNGATAAAVAYDCAGVYVETDRAGAFGRVSTADSGDIGQQVGLFDLYYLDQPDGGTFDVFIDGQRQRRVRTRADTASDAYATFHVPDGSHSFEVRSNGTGPVRIFGVAMERERPGVIVDTLGINGARARSQLLWNDETYRDQLARRRPDLVVLAYGTNESGDDSPIEHYEAKLREVIGRVREVVPNASCLLIGPSDRPVEIEPGVFEDRPRTAQVVEVQRRVSIDLGCGFYDLVAFQGGPLSMLEWAAADPPYGAPDHIHYTRRGYERLGETLLEALMSGYSGPASGGAPSIAPDASPASTGTATAAAEPASPPASAPGPG